MAANTNQTIIIKKIVKGGHGHHGGSWKVAYADFVTAMMAFFMLLWLLNVTTEEQKKGLADYFSPASISKSTSGSGGILGGRTLVSEGARISDNGVPSVAIALNPPTNPSETDVENEFDPEANAKGSVENENLDQALAKREEQAFEAAAQQLRKAIEDVPELAGLSQHLLIDMTPEGLRIQLVDRDGEPMFPSGSAYMRDYTRALLKQIALAIAKLPNKIAISGHTDATPFRTKTGYGNWELSTDRANASRRVLLEAGLDPKRVARVVGKADTDPLRPEDPFDATNRRISIVLIREQKTAAEIKKRESKAAARPIQPDTPTPEPTPAPPPLDTPAPVPAQPAPLPAPDQPMTVQ